MGLHDVVITGMGLSTPLGGDRETFARALLHGPAQFQVLRTAYTRGVPAALVEDDALEVETWPAHFDRATRLAVLAARRALDDAGVLEQPDWLRHCVTTLGNGCGPTESLHQSYAGLFETGRVAGLTLLRCLPCAPASAVAMSFGWTWRSTAAYSGASLPTTMARSSRPWPIAAGHASKMGTGC